MSSPSIACIGIIGKHDNPLHIAPFPPFSGPPSPHLSASSTSPESPLPSSSSAPSEEDPSPPPPASSSDPKPPLLDPPKPTANANLLEFSFLLTTSLDLIAARSRDRSRTDQDLGLLQNIDERLSMWGWLTSTGVKFVVVIDAWGKDWRGTKTPGVAGEGQATAGPGAEQTMTASTGSGERSIARSLSLGRRGKGGDLTASAGTLGGGGSGGGGIGKPVGDADVRVAFKALQTAYIRLLQNPFYVPDEHHPMAVAQGKGRGGPITSKKFLQEVERIGNTWRPGLTTI